jgi:hypothetical protein
MLRNYSAVTLYHASLVFWAYSIIASTTMVAPMLSDHMPTPVERLGPASEFPAELNRVYLDREANDDLRRFVVLGRGTPVVTAPKLPYGSPDIDVYPGPRHTPLSNIQTIMFYMSEILRRNNGTRTIDVVLSLSISVN